MTETAPPSSPTAATAGPSSPVLAHPSPASPQGGVVAFPSQPPAPNSAGTVAHAAPTADGTATTTGAASNAATGAVSDPSNPNALNNGYGSSYGNGYGSGYGSGYGGYGGYGMDPYMGMGGMGGMGMMGGLGMMGMGGMGMMGMGMYGMTPEAQRSQMMMFMISRMVELWGMFSNVVQMTLGSAIQFAGNYVGINQKLAQVEEEGLAQEERHLRAMQEHRQALLDLPESERSLSRDRMRQSTRRGKSRQRPSFVRSLISSILRHLIVFTIAYFTTKKIVSWYAARQKAKEIAAATAASVSAGTA